MNHFDDTTLRIEPVADDELGRVLELLLPRATPQQREQLAQERAARRPPQMLAWAAYRGTRLCGATRAHVQPGRAAVLAAPLLVAGEASSTAAELLQYGIGQLAEQGFRWLQALSTPGDDAGAQLWQSAGFHYVTNLVQLVSLAANFPVAQPDHKLTYAAYTPASHARLAGIVERTYYGSLDCRTAGFSRPVDDVLAAYRAAGPFDPARWLVAHDGEQDVGCLLLADDDQHNQSELVYLGVVPEARGGGLGLAMTRHAQWLARVAGRGRLVVAVDETNSPALAVYEAADFMAWDKRSVFVREL